jgi:hypothetical protein
MIEYDFDAYELVGFHAGMAILACRTCHATVYGESRAKNHANWHEIKFTIKNDELRIEYNWQEYYLRLNEAP